MHEGKGEGKGSFLVSSYSPHEGKGLGVLYGYLDSV